jgi:poly(A) polymerase
VLTEFLNRPEIQAVKKSADHYAKPCYLVGGCVRDYLLGRKIKDIDVVVLGSGIELAQLVRDSLGEEAHLSVFKNFGTAQIKYKDWEVEFVGARRESYSRNSRKPIVENGSLQDDQNRRDFTINALAIGLTGEEYGQWMDPFNGKDDLQKGIIRTPLDPDITYSDDPLRMMRAIRFATQLGFTIEEKSFHAIAKNKDRISIVSRERIADELNKIILCSKPSVGFSLLFDTGLLHLIFPLMANLQGVDFIGKKGHKDNFYHTLQVLDNICMKTDDLWLRWAAILHDIAKPHTKRFDPVQGWTFHGHEDKGARMVPKIFADLKLPLNEKMKFVQKMVLLHLRPIVLAKTEVTDSAVRRLLFEAGEDIDALMLLCEADITTKNPSKMQRYLSNFELVRLKLTDIEQRDKLRNWQPPISGEDIMNAFGLKPCREVGLIKDAIREAILEGDIPNEWEAAHKFMIEKGKEFQLNLHK